MDFLPADEHGKGCVLEGRGHAAERDERTADMERAAEERHALPRRTAGPEQRGVRGRAVEPISGKPGAVAP